MHYSPVVHINMYLMFFSKWISTWTKCLFNNFLLLIGFGTRLSTKIGEPCPDLNTTQIFKGKCRKFNRSIYEKSTGLVDAKFICFFVCILFGRNIIWTKVGVKVLKHLKKKIKKHEHFKSHVDKWMKICNLSMMVNNICQHLNEWKHPLGFNENR